MTESHFSKSYNEARRRFREAAEAVGARLGSYAVDVECEDELAIDVATLGPDDAPTIVVSSGIHGVEGFFGSAVQHALLDRMRQSRVDTGIRHVLIHAVNPFGFSQLRRANEDNVDLNRNFLAGDEEYEGAPGGYARLNGLLNPESPPSRFEPFRLKAMWNIWRSGLQAVKQSLAGGQYEYPRGLFFGGHGPCRSTRIIRENCDAWMGAAARIVHIDFHTGLGKFGDYKLLLSEGEKEQDLAWYRATFGAECVEPLDTPGGTAYRISGLFGDWMQKHFASRTYRFVGAEFGTYDVIRVIAALRAENRAHFHADPDSTLYKSAKAELLECLCPQDAAWKNRVLESGLRIVSQASLALKASPQRADDHH